MPRCGKFGVYVYVLNECEGGGQAEGGGGGELPSHCLYARGCTAQRGPDSGFDVCQSGEGGPVPLAAVWVCHSVASWL